MAFMCQLSCFFIKCLLSVQEEQLDEMEKMSNRNMELESRINLMLTGKEVHLYM
jgi:cell division protein FtsB